MKNKTLLAVMLSCTPVIALAHNLKLGESVPNVEIASYGEVILEGKETKFTKWSTQNMLGKVRVIQAIAGRSSAKELNAPMMTAITAAKFPEDSYQTTSIINQDDSIWGTGSFVKSSIQDSKKEFPWSSMVLDEDGVLAKNWDLAEESSAIIVQDKQGKILFVKEGALTQDEIKQVLALIEQNL